LESAAEEADLVLTSGATSAGATDVLVEIVEEIGEVQVHGVAIKPGKPTIVGRIDGTPYVGLPGYPVSALSVFRELVAPAIDAREDGWDRSVSARTARELRNDGGRHRLYAVGLVTDADGDRIAYPVDRGSGATTSLAYADGVVEIPAEQNYVAADDRVTVDLFDRESTPASVLCVGVRDPVVTAVVASVGRARALVRPGRTASRWLSDGIADAAVTTGDGPADGAERVAVFEREWGLVVDPALADSIGSLADLRGRRFVTLARETGLREAFDERVAAELDGELLSIVAGYAERAGFESARERVESGDADAALGLRPESGEPLAFVPLGTQRIAVDIAQQRREKPGVLALTDALSTAELPAGYERVR
ncbi:MAG: molybdopterin-binding protein, partial [Haloarculaceae archaeon]